MSQWNRRARTAGRKAAAEARKQGASLKEARRSYVKAYCKIYNNESPERRTAEKRRGVTPQRIASRRQWNKSLKGRAAERRRTTTLKRRHRQMLRRAKKLKLRGIKGYYLTLEQHRDKLYFKNGREKLCHYCGHENSKTGSGLDRKDSNIGYTLSSII